MYLSNINYNFTRDLIIISLCKMIILRSFSNFLKRKLSQYTALELFTDLSSFWKRIMLNLKLINCKK